MRLASSLALAVLFATGGCARRCCEPTRAVASPRLLAAPAPTVATSERQVFLDASIVRVPSATLADATPGARILGRTGAVVLLATWSADARATVVAMPKILALNGQEATLFVGETAPVPQGSAQLSFAVEGGDWTGYRMRATPTVAADGRSVRLTVVVESRDAISNGEPTPVVRGDARDVVVPEGSSLLVVSSPSRGDVVELTLIEPRVLRATAEASTR